MGGGTFLLCLFSFILGLRLLPGLGGGKRGKACERGVPWRVQLRQAGVKGEASAERGRGCRKLGVAGDARQKERNGKVL